MGWEMRRGQRVYYRKVREGARVRSIYCGSGERGERAAREDEERRAACATGGVTDFRDIKKEAVEVSDTRHVKKGSFGASELRARVRQERGAAETSVMAVLTAMTNGAGLWSALYNLDRRLYMEVCERGVRMICGRWPVDGTQFGRVEYPPPPVVVPRA